MSQDYPPLALDDLLHLMSPSPAPQTVDDPEIPPPPTRTKSTSPEHIQESDIQQMRNKVFELGQSHGVNTKLTSREKELAEMVLRLSSAVIPDSEQLVRQAEMISALTEQRDLLVHQAEEQRLRWVSEKDGWARMAEALIVQQTKSRSHTDEDYERLPAVEADNKTLRQRLTETQTRLQILESELTRLRPLLLMQPLISSTSMPPPTPKHKSQHPRKRKKDGPLTAEDEDHLASEDEPPPPPTETQDTPTPASHAQATPRVKSRKAEPSNPFTNTHKRRPSQKVVSRGLSADARVEHLLLAARKLGKQRAGVMSGMMQQFEERERERRREESAVTVVANTPKTPKRVAQATAYPQDGGYVYMNGQMRPGPGMHPVPVFIPAYPHHVLQTPSSSTTAPSVASPVQPSAQKQKQDARTTNPPTPLDSLLSAARSMMHEDVEVDEDEEVDVVGESEPAAGTRRARPRDVLDSPVPKRRKVSGPGDKLTALQLTSASMDVIVGTSKQGGTNAGVGRVRSALDVLADQAAAFSSQEQAPAPSQQPPQPQRKGKGKEKERTDAPETVGPSPKPRERQKSRRKEPEGDGNKALSTVPISRARTPRSDLGETVMASTEATSLREEGSTLEIPNDPGGGGGTSGTSHPSSSSSSQSVEQQSGTAVDRTPTPQRPSTPSTQADESGETTPRASTPHRAHITHHEDRLQSESTLPSEPDLALQALHERAPSVPAPESREESLGVAQPRQRAETAPAAPAKNKDLVRVAGQDGSVPGSGSGSAPTPPGKRQRSPYVKWSKEEDDLLSQAVAKYGQKWDLVQKALPSRGYHQVRQRWLRKLGVFDSKPDLSSFQTAAGTFGHHPHGDAVGVGGGLEPRPNPKLGLAPLSSERAFSAVLARGERGGSGMSMGMGMGS